MTSYSQTIKDSCAASLSKRPCCRANFDYGRNLFLPPEKRDPTFDLSRFGDENGIAFSSFRCKDCKESFLKGVFISCGTVSDPKKSYDLELRIYKKELADALNELLRNNSIEPKTRFFRNKYCLYLRRCEDIQSFLFLLGEQKEAFRLADGKIRRDFVNNANRASNCDTRNIKKAVEAAGNEVRAIKTLFDTGKINLLDEELKETARLRLENEEATLSELALLHSEKISKSGVYHRLRKIAEAAQSK